MMKNYYFKSKNFILRQSITIKIFQIIDLYLKKLLPQVNFTA